VTTHTSTPEFDTLAFIMRLEDGTATEEDVINGMQELINSGLAWRLQGCYGRLAHDLIECGHCHPAARN
jgi:hypothetical protein